MTTRARRAWSASLSTAGVACLLLVATTSSTSSALTGPTDSDPVRRGARVHRAASTVPGAPSLHVAQDASAPEYVGSEACRACHFRIYRSWRETTHADVFERLRPGVAAEAKRRLSLDPDRDYRDNEFCLKCHTVGYGEPGGFVGVEETPGLTGVGCESCHGPGGDYIADDVMGKENLDHSFREVIEAGLIYPVPEEACLRCHGEETPFNASVDPEYAFEYTRETLGSATHVHPTLRRDHGPLPEGVIFQQEYAGDDGP